MSLDTQWLTIAIMLLSGAGMGVLFDSYRVVADHFKFPKWSISTLDMLYWLTSAVIVFRLLYLSNYGEVRGYVYLGLVLGIIIYAFLLSNIYSKIVVLIISIIQHIVRVIMKVFAILIISPLKMLYKFVIFCIKIGTKFTIRLLQIVLQLFIPIVKVIFWPLKPLYKPLFSFIYRYWMKWVHPHLIKWTWLAKIKSIILKTFSVVKNWLYS